MLGGAVDSFGINYPNDRLVSEYITSAAEFVVTLEAGCQKNNPLTRRGGVELEAEVDVEVEVTEVTEVGK